MLDCCVLTKIDIQRSLHHHCMCHYRLLTAAFLLPFHNIQKQCSIWGSMVVVEAVSVLRLTVVLVEEVDVSRCVAM